MSELRAMVEKIRDGKFKINSRTMYAPNVVIFARTGPVLSLVSGLNVERWVTMIAGPAHTIGHIIHGSTASPGLLKSLLLISEDATLIFYRDFLIELSQFLPDAEEKHLYTNPLEIAQSKVWNILMWACEYWSDSKDIKLCFENNQIGHDSIGKVEYRTVPMSAEMATKYEQWLVSRERGKMILMEPFLDIVNKIRGERGLGKITVEKTKELIHTRPKVTNQ